MKYSVELSQQIDQDWQFWHGWKVLKGGEEEGSQDPRLLVLNLSLIRFKILSEKFAIMKTGTDGEGIRTLTQGWGLDILGEKVP